MKDRIAIVIFGNTFNDNKRLKEAFEKTTTLLGVKANDVVVIANDMKDNTLVEELCDSYGVKVKFQLTKWKDYDDKPCVIRKQNGHRYNFFAVMNRNSRMMRFVSKAEKKALIVVYSEENMNVEQLLRTAKKYNVKIAKIKYKGE